MKTATANRFKRPARSEGFHRRLSVVAGGNPGRVAAMLLFVVWRGFQVVAAEPNQLQYIIEPGIPGAYSRTHISLLFQGSRDGTNRLVLPTGYFDGDSANKSIQDLRVTSPGAQLAAMANPNLRMLTHNPNTTVRVEYDVVQQPNPEKITADRGKPKPYFYHFGESIWVVPELDEKTPLRIDLEWKNVPDDWEIGNSYGIRQRRQVIHDSIERFRHATFLGGDFRFRQFRVHGTAVTIARRGDWTYSDQEVEDTLRRLYTTESDFWHDSDFLYTLIVLYPTGASSGNFGGEGRTRSFSMHLSEADKLSFAVLHMISHELFHSWNPEKLKWDGQSAYWFTEGFTDYYGAVLLRRAGLCSFEQFVGYINEVLKGYSVSDARNYPYERLIKERDTSFDIDRMLYRRGMLQALNWDGQIRQKTSGKHSLDDVMHGLLRAALAQKAFTLVNGSIAAALRPFLNHDPAADIQQFMEDGKTITPFGYALGLNVVLGNVEIPKFELGFDADSFNTKVIKSVKEGSNAYRAGLRDGQILLRAGLTGDPGVPVELVITDAGKTRKISYFPQGSRISVPQFRILPNNPVMHK